MGAMAATPGVAPKQGGYPSAYGPRNPRATSLYQLLDKHYETVKGVWDERFERRHGFWRGYWDTAIASYLDCGLFESGFARVVCPRCRAEFLVAFSCKGRGLCPSCGAKRTAIFLRVAPTKTSRRCPSRSMGFLDSKNAPALFPISSRASRRARTTRLRNRTRDDDDRPPSKSPTLGPEWSLSSKPLVPR